MRLYQEFQNSDPNFHKFSKGGTDKNRESSSARNSPFKVRRVYANQGAINMNPQIVVPPEIWKKQTEWFSLSCRCVRRFLNSKIFLLFFASYWSSPNGHANSLYF